MFGLGCDYRACGAAVCMGGHGGRRRCKKQTTLADHSRTASGHRSLGHCQWRTRSRAGAH
eukprot:5278276-Prymnesium_polylepis.1